MFTRRSTAGWLSSFLLALTIQAPQQPGGRVVITRDGGPATGVDVTLVVGGEKRTDVGANLKAVSEKYPKDTRVDVYKRACDTGKLEILLVPAGELLGVDDKDCLKAKEPPPGQPCRCGWLGGFTLGESVTIDAETGKISGA